MTSPPLVDLRGASTVSSELHYIYRAMCAWSYGRPCHRIKVAHLKPPQFMRPDPNFWYGGRPPRVRKALGVDGAIARAGPERQGNSICGHNAEQSEVSRKLTGLPKKKKKVNN